MNPLDSTKMMYQPWSEEAFQSDMFVRYMTPLQQWMYRTLCQAAFNCSERPYLPDNDATLWMLAGCETQKQWTENCAPVRAMFTPIEKDGKHLLSRKRLVEDWSRCQTRLTEKIEQRRAAGRKSAEKCQRGPDGTFIPKENPLVDQQNTSDTPRESNATQREPNENPTESNQLNSTQPNPTTTVAGGSDPAGWQAGSPAEEPTSVPNARAKCAGKENQGRGSVVTFESMQEAWTEYREENGEDCIAVGLQKSGFSKLNDVLKEANLQSRVVEVKAAFNRWIEEHYFPSLDTPNRVISPLSVFADHAVRYVAAVEKQS